MHSDALGSLCISLYLFVLNYDEVERSRSCCMVANLGGMLHWGFKEMPWQLCCTSGESLCRSLAWCKIIQNLDGCLLHLLVWALSSAGTKVQGVRQAAEEWQKHWSRSSWLWHWQGNMLQVRCEWLSGTQGYHCRKRQVIQWGAWNWTYENLDNRHCFQSRNEGWKCQMCGRCLQKPSQGCSGTTLWGTFPRWQGKEWVACGFLQLKGRHRAERSSWPSGSWPGEWPSWHEQGFKETKKETWTLGEFGRKIWLHGESSEQRTVRHGCPCQSWCCLLWLQWRRRRILCQFPAGGRRGFSCTPGLLGFQRSERTSAKPLVVSIKSCAACSPEAWIPAKWAKWVVTASRDQQWIMMNLWSVKQLSAVAQAAGSESWPMPFGILSHFISRKSDSKIFIHMTQLCHCGWEQFTIPKSRNVVPEQSAETQHILTV